MFSTNNAKSTSKIYKLKHLIFKKEIETSLCYSFSWLAIVVQSVRTCDFVSNYLMIFGKLFRIYKLIHID